MSVQLLSEKRVLTGNVLNQFKHLYSSLSTVGDCSTEATLVTFGFPVSALRVENMGGVDAFFDLAGSTDLTTNGGRLGAGRSVECSLSTPISMLSLYATSTGAGGFSVDVLGLGSLSVPIVGSDALGVGVGESVNELLHGVVSHEVVAVGVSEAGTVV